MKGNGFSLFESLEGAALIAFNLLTPFLRGQRERWGASDHEVRRRLPGDKRVSHPRWQYTRAITINAPELDVWNWLVQIGANRAGLYSYEGLENLLDCQIHNANQIVPEYQHLEPGDEITLHPKAPGMKVVEVQNGRYILIHNDSRKRGRRAYINTTWLLYLEPIDASTTRLISRGRYAYTPSVANKLWMGPLLIEPIGFVMERKMLLEIRRHAEQRWVLQPLWAN